MKTHVLGSILDTKAGIYMSPQLFRNKPDFVRQVQVAAKDKSSMLNKFPADYDLMIIGEWDEASGIISAEKQRIGSVLDLCPLD